MRPPPARASLPVVAPNVTACHGAAHLGSRLITGLASVATPARNDREDDMTRTATETRLTNLARRLAGDPAETGHARPTVWREQGRYRIECAAHGSDRAAGWVGSSAKAAEATIRERYAR